MTVSRISRVAFVFTLALASCSVFDESLIPEESTGTTEPLRVADHLSCSVPMNESVNAYRSVNLSEFDDSIPSLPNCLGEVDAPGNDTFFAVRMNANEKWHFHVQAPTTASDPAVYVLDSCSDLRSCRDTYWGINACGDGENEHFSFVAPATGDYFVGVDGVRAGGEAIEVFAVRADCGNDEKEHSEFCDDGNDDPLDGCHECRPVLSEDTAEIEPNDGPLDPDLLVLPAEGGSMRITSTLGSRCDFDFFRLDVPANAELALSLSGNASACRLADLQIRELDSPNPFLVDSAADPSGACAELVRGDLRAGTYLIRVAPRRVPGVAAAAVNYALDVSPTPL